MDKSVKGGKGLRGDSLICRHQLAVCGLLDIVKKMLGLHATQQPLSTELLDGILFHVEDSTGGLPRQNLLQQSRVDLGQTVMRQLY